MVEECEDEESRKEVAQVAANFLNQDFPETTFGAPKAGYAKWASVIRVVNPIKVFSQIIFANFGVFVAWLFQWYQRILRIIRSDIKDTCSLKTLLVLFYSWCSSV